jgi:hypothetical protein
MLKMVRTPSSFHGRVVVRGEHKANAHIADAISDLLGLQIDVDAQRFHRIGAAGFAAHAAPAVLADFATGRRNHKRRTSRDVEGVGTIAAGADDVHQVGFVVHMHLVGKLAHHLGGGGDFANRFLLHAQAGEDGGGHHGRELAAHDLAHQLQHFVVEDFTVLDGALQRFLGGELGHDKSFATFSEAVCAWQLMVLDVYCLENQ